MILYDILKVLPAKTRLHISFDHKLSVETITSEENNLYLRSICGDVYPILDLYATGKDEIYIRVTEPKPQDESSDNNESAF